MLLQELFDHISELDSYSLILDGSDNDALDAAAFPKVIRAINLGLLEIYKEFSVKENSVVVQLYDHITEYRLNSLYAQSNVGSAEVYKYIMDTVDRPFEDDVLKIERVYNEVSFELPINDDRFDFSVFTPQYDLIQHPYPDSANAIYVHYKAKHPRIAVDADPATTEVVIPEQTLNLLLVWINHKLLTTLNKDDALKKLGEYQSLLLQTKNNQTFRADETASEKLDVRGWP